MTGELPPIFDPPNKKDEKKGRDDPIFDAIAQRVADGTSTSSEAIAAMRRICSNPNTALSNIEDESDSSDDAMQARIG